MDAVIRIPDAMWSATRDWLLGSRNERMAYLLARASVIVDPWQSAVTDVLVRQSLLIPDEVLTMQNPVRVEIDPAFTQAVLVLCYETGLSLIDVHTHPFAGRQVAFSGHDVANMRETHAEFRRTIPQQPPAVAASLVCGTDSLAAAWLDPESGAIAPVAAVQLLGAHTRMVTLCRN